MSDSASLLSIDKFPISFYVGAYRINYFPLDNKNVDELLLNKNNPEISQLIFKSHKTRLASRLLTFSVIPSGILFFSILLGHVENEYISTAALGVGALCVSAGIVLAVRAKSKRREAVDLYNKTYFGY